MADEKKEAPKETVSSAYIILGVIILIILIAARLDGENIYGEKINGTSKTSTSDVSKPYTWFGNNALTLGSTVINIENTIVRVNPAGSIVGNQKKLITGRLLEGPVHEFNVDWWRIDYPTAPDGWVEYKSLSPKVATVKALNIIPITYTFFKPIGYFLILLFLFLYIYFRLQLKREESISERKIRLKEEHYQKPEKTLAQKIADKPDVQEISGFQTEEIFPVHVAEKNNRWIHITELLSSYNESDWRQAIIEADIILEEMLDQMGYKGTTIGERLKTVEKADFLTLNQAWEAHKVRNQIAHDGSSFKVSRDLAEQTIKKFEEVFREFYYI